MFDKIRGIIAKKVGISNNEVFMSSDLYEDMGFDSLTFVELLYLIEDSLNISINDNDAMKFKTVGDIVRYLEQI